VSESEELVGINHRRWWEWNSWIKRKGIWCNGHLLKALSTCVVFLHMMPKVKPSIPLSTFTFVN